MVLREPVEDLIAVPETIVITFPVPNVPPPPPSVPQAKRPLTSVSIVSQFCKLLTFSDAPERLPRTLTSVLNWKRCDPWRNLSV